MNAVASIFLVLCGLFRRYMVLWGLVWQTAAKEIRIYGRKDTQEESALQWHPSEEV